MYILYRENVHFVARFPHFKWSLSAGHVTGVAWRHAPLLSRCGYLDWPLQAGEERGGFIPPLFCKTSTVANGLFSCLGYYVHVLLKGHVPTCPRLDNTATLIGCIKTGVISIWPIIHKMFPTTIHPFCFYDFH